MQILLNSSEEGIEKGLGLIELKLDPKDFRKKLLYLTIKGEKLKNSLLIS